VTARTRSEQLDTEILDAIAELFGRLVAHGERTAQRFAVPSFFIKVLHMLDCPMAMKELGQRMRCDPSFVTIVADTLEKRGLARREPHPGDRRVKKLILTSAGLDLKQRIEREVAARMPWRAALTEPEREQLLELIRKMIRADAAAAGDLPDESQHPLDRAGVTIQSAAGDTDTGILIHPSPAP
jgi:MarR family transcriptional regulator, organic hydroperoxide resistance regulator